MYYSVKRGSREKGNNVWGLNYFFVSKYFKYKKIEDKVLFRVAILRLLEYHF
jgi:hypothetical protein